MPLGTPQKLILSTAQFRVPVFYDISRDLTDECYVVVWGCHPPQGPPKWSPKIDFLTGPS